MSPDSKMIAMEALQEIVETVTYTAPIEGTIPISVMLVGPPGTGKSKAIMQYNCASLHATNDITSSGLSELLTDDREGLIRHIVIPDFNVVVSHKTSTSTLTIANLLSIMSEGTMRVDDGRRVKEMKHAPIGIITAMTREVFEMHARKFTQLGIGRRFVSIFFDYSIITRQKIQQEISDGEITLQQLIPRTVELPRLDRWPIRIRIAPREASTIRELSKYMADNLSYQPKWTKSNEGAWVIKPFHGTVPVEFTPHMILRTMAQGHALLSKRIEVHREDTDFLMNFIMFTNYSAPVQL
jgi:hypothetical protein